MMKSKQANIYFIPNQCWKMFQTHKASFGEGEGREGLWNSLVCSTKRDQTCGCDLKAT